MGRETLHQPRYSSTRPTVSLTGLSLDLDDYAGPSHRVDGNDIKEIHGYGQWHREMVQHY